MADCANKTVAEQISIYKHTTRVNTRLWSANYIKHVRLSVACTRTHNHNHNGVCGTKIKLNGNSNIMTPTVRVEVEGI